MLYLFIIFDQSGNWLCYNILLHSERSTAQSPFALRSPRLPSSNSRTSTEVVVIQETPRAGPRRVTRYPSTVESKERGMW